MTFRIRAGYIKSILLCGLLSLSPGACIQVPATIAHNQDLPHTHANGYDFHTMIAGNPANPPLIVVHGGPGADFHYLLALQELSDQYYILFYDQRGTGLSPREDPDKHTVQLFINDLDALIDQHAKGRKIRIIGHSWGAMLAIAWANQYGNKASHIIAAEPGILKPAAWQPFTEKVKGMQSFGMFLRAIPIFLQLPFIQSQDEHESMDFVMTRFTQMGGKDSPYLCEAETVPDTASIQRAGYESFDAMLTPYMENPSQWDFDFTTDMQKYKGQLLLLSSSCSFLGYDWQERYHRPFLPAQTQHVRLEKTGHYMFTIAPEKAIARVRKFLK